MELWSFESVELWICEFVKHGCSRWISKYIFFYKSKHFRLFWWLNGDNIRRIQALDINQKVRVGIVFSEVYVSWSTGIHHNSLPSILVTIINKGHIWQVVYFLDNILSCTLPWFTLGRTGWSYWEDPGLGDKLVDEGGECILQEGAFWTTGGQHSLMGYYILFTITS